MGTRIPLLLQTQVEFAHIMALFSGRMAWTMRTWKIMLEFREKRNLCKDTFSSVLEVWKTWTLNVERWTVRTYSLSVDNRGWGMLRVIHLWIVHSPVWIQSDCFLFNKFGGDTSVQDYVERLLDVILTAPEIWKEILYIYYHQILKVLQSWNLLQVPHPRAACFEKKKSDVSLWISDYFFCKKHGIPKAESWVREVYVLYIV